MLVGGALVNALAFSGSKFLFSKLHDTGADEERKRHDITGNAQTNSLDQEPESKLSHFYLPSPEQRDREIAFVIMGLGATAFVASMLTK